MPSLQQSADDGDPLQRPRVLLVPSRCRILTVVTHCNDSSFAEADARGKNMSKEERFDDNENDENELWSHGCEAA